MKTRKILNLLLIVVLSFALTLALAACQHDVTVSYYAVEVTKTINANIATDTVDCAVEEEASTITATVKTNGDFTVKVGEEDEVVVAKYSVTVAEEVITITFTNVATGHTVAQEEAEEGFAVEYSGAGIDEAVVFEFAAAVADDAVLALEKGLETAANVYFYESVLLGTEVVKAGQPATGVLTAEDETAYQIFEVYPSENIRTDSAVDLSAPINADVSFYAETTEYAISLGLATGDGYTLNYATTVFPTTWNPHTYQTDTDSTILGYSSSGFYTFDYNATRDGFIWVDDMAIGDPVDVTADYVGEEWGIAEGDEARAWKVTIRNDLCWDDGTPITSADFITSTKLLLNPYAQNERADDYTYAGDFVIHNAQNYLYQGREGVFNAMDLISEATYDAEQHDESLIFALGSPAENTEAYGLDGECYFRTAFGFPGSYTAAMAAAYVKTYYVPTLDLAVVAQMEGRTLAEIKADATMAAEWNKIWGDFWGAVPGEEIHFCLMEGAFPACDFEDVGIKAPSATEVVFILDAPLEGFYLKYGMGAWLVKEDLYLSCSNLVAGEEGEVDYVLAEGEEVFETTYCTDVETSVSYGPYKLTQYQLDKFFRIEKNLNWWGYDDEENEGLYQTTAINYIMAESASTRLQMFLTGQLDSYGLTADDMEDYQSSDYTYYTDGDSTWFIAINPNLEAYEAAEYALNPDGSQGAHKNIDKQILAIKEFRQALCYALDRAAYELACDPTGNVAKALFSPMIVSNPEIGETYRTTDEAKQAIVKFWGIADEIGEGKLYATIDDAIESITGYNLALAKEMFDAAYAKAVDLEYIDDDDVVEICIGTPNATSSYYNKGYDFLVNCYTEAVVGTELEGKLKFTRDSTLGNAFSDALRNGQVDMLFGVGWTGSALNPYGLMSAYTTASNRYDTAWDTSSEFIDIELPRAFVEGDSELEGKALYRASIQYWTYAIQGSTIPVVAIDEEGEETEEIYSVSLGSNVDAIYRLPVLAALEGAVLNQYDMIPIAYDSSASLKSMKYEYYTEEYIYGVGRGGVKYLAFNYTDAEWAAFIAENNGKLDYTASAE